MKCFHLSLLATAVLLGNLGQQAEAQLLHLWDFNAGNELADSAGSLDLNFAPGEGGVTTDDNGTPDDTTDDTIVMGTAGDVSFEPGYNGIGQAYRPYYVDPTMSSTAGAGLTGRVIRDDNGTPDDTTDDTTIGGFASPTQFTIETIVKADEKTTGSAVNYIFQTRPGSDRGYYLIQDEDNLSRNAVGGIGGVVGNNFGDIGIAEEYNASGTWLYVAAVFDFSPEATVLADYYTANLSAGETIPTLSLDDRVWNTANPDTLSNNFGIFGIGNFAIDRDGDGIAEASQEWFQGAIDYVAIYSGLLDSAALANNLSARLVPEPTSLACLCLGGLFLVARRRS